MTNHDKKILITDTSVIINFLSINRIDLLKVYPGTFYITEHVIDEITADFPEQLVLLNSSIKTNDFTVVSVSAEADLKLYNDLIKEHRLGSGECSAIAYAINHKYCLVIDDVRAKKKAITIAEDLTVLSTQEIMITLINDNVLTVAEADKIKNSWEVHFRFKLKFNSFYEILI